MFNYLTHYKIKRIITGEEITNAKNAFVLSSYYYFHKSLFKHATGNAIKS